MALRSGTNNRSVKPCYSKMYSGSSILRQGPIMVEFGSDALVARARSRLPSSGNKFSKMKLCRPSCVKLKRSLTEGPSISSSAAVMTEVEPSPQKFDCQRCHPGRG